MYLFLLNEGPHVELVVIFITIVFYTTIVLKKTNLKRKRLISFETVFSLIQTIRVKHLTLGY